MQYNIEYLNSLIENKVEENLNLEYKSSMSLDKHPTKTIEVSKDVSAMANSDGGIIIYGITEDDELRHLPKGLSPINRTDFSKEWLEQIINDKIRPRIENIKIHPVIISDPQVIYVVEISKSDTAHQADDKKYYKRFNFQSVPMYDYEIRDILNRQRHPKLELSFGFENTPATLVVYINNVGSVLAKYVNVKIQLPSRIVDNLQRNRIVHGNIVEQNRNIVKISAANTIREMVDPFAQVARYWPSRYEPVLPQSKFMLTKIELRNHPFDNENILTWEIFCDNINPIRGTFRLADLLNH
jgi:hypothetical protein